MKLGVSINAFDGTEHILRAISAIRNHVDYISIVWQSKSNVGNEINAMDKLYIFLMQTMVDDIIEYNPDFNIEASKNEQNKRNIGLELSRAKGCTHHLSMDCDEIYDSEQFEKAKHLAEEFDTTACKMQTYYGDSEHKFKTPEEYYVPFIYKIDNRKFEFFKKYPFVCDPTRKMAPIKVKLFERSELEMHHLSWVRRDIKSKLVNSSAFKNRTPKEIKDICIHHNNWKPGQPGLTHSGLIELI